MMQSVPCSREIIVAFGGFPLRVLLIASGGKSTRLTFALTVSKNVLINLYELCGR